MKVQWMLAETIEPKYGLWYAAEGTENMMGNYMR